MTPVKTVQDLIEQLREFPGDTQVGIGTAEAMAHIKAIHSTEMFGWEVGPNGERITALHPCVVLEAVEKPS